MNLPTRSFSLGLREDVRGEEAAYDSTCASTEPSRSSRQRARQLRVRRFGPRSRAGRAVRAARSRSRPNGGSTSARPYEPRRTDAGHEQHDAEHEAAAMPSLAVHACRTAPKRPLPDERAARREREVVRRRCAMSSATSSTVSSWNSSSIRLGREDQRDERRPRRRGSPPRIAARRDERCRRRCRARAGARAPGSTSCSSGWKKPGATTNTIAHRPLSAA